MSPPRAEDQDRRRPGLHLAPARQRATARAPGRTVAAAAIVLAGILSGQGQAAEGKAVPDKAARADSVAVAKPAERAHRVIVYYFYTTYRCASCRAIEANTREALESAFADSLKSGGLVWRTVNVDEKDNKHFVKDYQLFTKSLVLVTEVKGGPPAWKNLAKIWELLPDKPAFQKYVQDEVRACLVLRT